MGHDWIDAHDNFRLTGVLFDEVLRRAYCTKVAVWMMAYQKRIIVAI